VSAIVGFEVIDDRTVGEGGFLKIRRLRLRLVRDDGTRTREGLYDFVERPMGLDAVVLALYHRGHRAPGGAVRVLLREGLRVPLLFGRGAPPVGAPPLHAEVVAGIAEVGEDDEPALRRRAAAEAHEEAGLLIAPESIVRLGGPVFPTAGMCAEQFHLFAAEVDAAQLASAHAPPGDGSPFEEGARLRWIDLAQALADFSRGALSDLKTEVTLRRLADYLASR
jgi:ADP-ribose pyrophosphatase